MKLNMLLKGIRYKGYIVKNHKVNSLKTSSKEILYNDIFFAIKGAYNDGNEYISEAIKKGATTIISEVKATKKNKDINYIIVEEITTVLAYMAKVFYKNLTKKYTMIAVTGTNGKTTTTSILYDYFKCKNRKTILIGTNGIKFFDEEIKTNNTTPDILKIYNTLEYGIKKGYKTCVMEVSSIGIRENRCKFFNFDIVLFTNLSHDHLDYHENITDYAFSKGLLLWKIYGRNTTIIMNKDDNCYKFYLRNLENKHLSFGNNDADIRLEKYYTSISHSLFNVDVLGKEYFFKTNLVGIFNIYNLLAVISILFTMNYDINDFKKFLEAYKLANGRMEYLRYKEKNIFIDFAHTPDGFEKVLAFLAQNKKNKLNVVFGCGGNRDKSKRKLMGSIAAKYADMIYLTNDNPRDEDEKSIIEDILLGINDHHKCKVILDRKKAVFGAIKNSDYDDIIAILGKGNENYQEIKGIKYRYNDKDCLNQLINDEN